MLDRFDIGDHLGLLLAPVEAVGHGAPPLMFSAVRGLPAGHPV